MSKWKRMITFLFAAALLFSTTAFARPIGDEPPHYTVACIGDSLTFGTGSANPYRESWPSVLADKTGALDLDTINYGVYGSTVEMYTPWSYNDTRCFSDSLTSDAEVFLVLLGSNDCNSPSPEWTFDEAYRRLLTTYIELPQSPTVVVILPPDMYYDSFPLSLSNENIDDIRAAERRIASELGLDVIDLSAISGDMEEYCVDGGHYNSTGYAMFADYIYDELCAIL